MTEDAPQRTILIQTHMDWEGPAADGVIDCTTLFESKKSIKRSPEFDDGTDEYQAIEFLEDLFAAVYSMYKPRHDLTDGEAIFNHTGTLSVFDGSFFDAVAAANVSGCGFLPGETTLNSMTQQLENVGRHKDDRYQYKADGVFRLLDKKKLEILLLETSSGFGCRDKVKISFDHHKGAFGAVAMLKSTADQYPYASVSRFRKIKVFFVHAAGNKLHLWSLSFKNDGVYW
ncbi:hypothetical protein BCR42DRAFT_371771 [Absidia repens]|uniref:Uncharacterized protein n=1 Tax=Absidia repens TaxID=90262 RepID=A0A1X2IPG5_9FUNG|nr:hypothetical protein BCR42DRAFT_371771 [Absidia repens]